MKSSERLKFLEWHEENKNIGFNMSRDIINYCRSEVDILTRACMQFRKMFLEICNVCPFTEACTVASSTFLTFRRNFLEGYKIGLVPRGGYRNVDNQSKGAIKWMIWLEYTRGVKIQNSAKGREVVLCGVKVDGFFVETNNCYEYLGCFWHGCKVCFLSKRDAPLYGESHITLNSRYEHTMRKTERLRKLGYTVTEIWECEFDKTFF